MQTYISHPVVAEQFHIGEIPKILKGEDGRALVTCRLGSNKPMNIINEIVIIHDDKSEVVVDPGDWIVRNVLGEFLVYAHEEFTRECAGRGMMLGYQQLVDELLQLSLWIELLARQEGGATRDQRVLIASRVRRVMKRLETF